MELYSLAAREVRARQRSLDTDTRFFLGLNTAVVAAAGIILDVGSTHRFDPFTAVVFAAGIVMAQFGVFTLNRGEQNLRPAAKQLRSLQQIVGIPDALAAGDSHGPGRAGSAPGHRRSVLRRAVLVLLAMTVVDIAGLVSVLLH